MNEKWTALIKRNSNNYGKVFEINLFTQTGDVALRVQHDTISDSKAHLKRLQRQTGHKFATEIQA